MAPPKAHPRNRQCNQSRNMCKVVESPSIIPLTCKDLEKITDNFSNCIGKLQFGKVYRGNVESEWATARPVTVKIWEHPIQFYYYHRGHKEMRMMDEVVLLRHARLNCHPGMIKLYGYCCERELVGVVYDFESNDTVQNLITNGPFTWLNRVKVAIGIADLLTFLHSQNFQNGPFVIRNIDPSHIMVDKDYNPKLFDFGLIAGGIFGCERNHTQLSRGCLGSIDYHYPSDCQWTPVVDVFAFGVLLMKLMSNRVDHIKDDTEESEDEDSTGLEYNETTGVVCYWVYQKVVAEYERSDLSMMSHRSMVAPCLQDDESFIPADGVEMSKLAYECVHSYDRPTMEQVLARLRKLQIAEKYKDELGMERNVVKIKEEQ